MYVHTEADARCQGSLSAGVSRFTNRMDDFELRWRSADSELAMDARSRRYWDSATPDQCNTGMQAQRSTGISWVLGRQGKIEPDTGKHKHNHRHKAVLCMYVRDREPEQCPSPSLSSQARRQGRPSAKTTHGFRAMLVDQVCANGWKAGGSGRGKGGGIWTRDH